jgi:hypothetical protein
MYRALSIGLLVAACAAISLSPQASGEAGWTTILNGKSMDGWSKVGDANWRVEDGAVVADKTTGKGGSFLVSKNSYGDVMIRAEFWVSNDANSGIYFRCSDINKITDRTCYEANIFDERPDPSFGTGALMHLAKVPAPIKVGGTWSTYEITAKGPQLIAVLNGKKTAEANDKQFAKGPIALQWGRGTVKFRSVQVRPL